jgi:hypothetical protein
LALTSPKKGKVPYRCVYHAIVPTDTAPAEASVMREAVEDWSDKVNIKLAGGVIKRTDCFAVDEEVDEARRAWVGATKFTQ